MDDFKSSIDELKADVKELVKQGAVNTQILIEHERRSTNLETRLDPIEKDWVFRSKLTHIALSSSGLIGLLFTLFKVFKL